MTTAAPCQTRVLLDLSSPAPPLQRAIHPFLDAPHPPANTFKLSPTDIRPDFSHSSPHLVLPKMQPAPALHRMRPKLSISIPPPVFYHTPTALRRVLKRLRAADQLSECRDLCIPYYPTFSQQHHVIVDISSPRVSALDATLTSRDVRVKSWLAPLSLHPALCFFVAILFLALGALHYWPL